MNKNKLEKLLNEYQEKANAIRIVLRLFDSQSSEKLDKQIVKHVKKQIKRVHWMHRPENAAKKARWIKKMRRMNRQRRIV